MARTIWRAIRASPIGSGIAALLVLMATALLLLLIREVQSTHGIALPAGPAAESDPAPTATPTAPRRVLVLNSYHYGYAWTDQQLLGILETLRRARPAVSPAVEYLDSKHISKMQHFDGLRALLALKYHGTTFAVVIAADNPALEFVTRYRAELFPDAPIVFGGINGYRPEIIADQRNITGIAEVENIGGTLALALRLHPDTRRVVVLHDYTVTGLATRREAERQLRPLAGRVAIDYLPDLSIDELCATLRTLAPGTLVLAMSYSSDAEGRVIEPEEIARLIAASSPVPAYALHEERLGYGVVGGNMHGGRGEGQRAAELALAILSGTPADSIPVDTRAMGRAMFDYNLLVRFGIPLSALPPAAVVVNRPVAFVTEHAEVVASAFGIFFILVAGIVMLALATHRRRTAEERQHRLQEQLLQAQKMEEIGQLAGGVAHDFNNVLTAVSGYASLVSTTLPAGHPAHPFVEQLALAAGRGAQLTQSLLAFSRKHELALGPVEIRELVRGFEAMARRIIGEGIAIEARLAPGPLFVRGDRSGLEQILLNLCANARDAMPKGGRIVIATSTLEVEESYRKAHLLERAGAYVVLAVSDTGVGMDAATRQQIFEPFFTTKEVGKGTGLGLAIVYGIVQHHHGVVICDSALGEGTTFQILLPRCEAAQTSTHSVAAASRGGSETILLAEDDAAVRTVLEMVLRNAGYKVILAADGEEAVEQFRAHRDAVQLLLSDVAMPRKNGRETYEAIKASKPDVRVLLMSGYTDELLGAKWIPSIAVPQISKPVMPDQLLARVRELLDGGPATSHDEPR